MKQRECDIQRREKENSGYKRLFALLRAQRASEVEAEEEESSEKSKLNKANILRQSAERIEQLQRAVSELVDACACFSESAPEGEHDSPHICSRPPSHVDDLPLSSSPDSPLICAPTASATPSPLTRPSASCSSTCPAAWWWTAATRTWLTTAGSGRTSSDAASSSVQSHRRRPAMNSCSPTIQQENRVLVHSGTRRVPSKQEPQYEKSMRQLQELYQGKVHTIDALWRGQLGDGKKYGTTLSTQPHSTAQRTRTNWRRQPGGLYLISSHCVCCCCCCCCVRCAMVAGTSVALTVGLASGRSVVRGRSTTTCVNLDTPSVLSAPATRSASTSE